MSKELQKDAIQFHKFDNQNFKTPTNTWKSYENYASTAAYNQKQE